MSEEEYDETQLPVEDTMGLLIELVQSYEYLYDLSHTDYKNTKKKEEAWKNIASILQTSVEECQKMWKQLRDRYTREKRSKSGAPAPESKWAFYNKMSFYMKYSKPRKTHTATPAKPSTSKESMDLLGDNEWSTLNVLVPSGSPNTQETIPETEAPKPSKRAKIQRVEEDSLLYVAKELSTTIKNRALPNQNRTFVEHIFSMLEDLPADEAKKKRKTILQKLYEDEL